MAPDYGLGFQAKALKTFEGGLVPLGSKEDLDIEGVGRGDVVEVGFRTPVSTLSSTHKSAGSTTTWRLRAYELFRNKWYPSIRMNYFATNRIYRYRNKSSPSLRFFRAKRRWNLDIEGVGRDNVVEAGFRTQVSTLSSTHKSAGSPTTRKLPSGW